MKKFYSVAVAMCFFVCLQSTSVFAITYPVTSAKTWTTSTIPNPCTGCTINISGGGVLTVDIPVTLVNSTINVTGNTQLVIAANLTLQNSQIVVGDVSSTASTANIFINSGASILMSDAASTVRLGNVNNYISGGTGTPPGEIQAPVTITILGFTFTRYVAFYSAVGAATGSPYNLNCGAGKPNTCKTGFVYGPVINSQTNLGGFVTFTTLGTDSPLPVVLGSFSASLTTDNSVLVSWTTEQEVNSSYFSVERSSNSSDWNAIGTVGAKGNSAIVSAYSFTDNSAQNGVNYYRLKMVDLDGSFVYSPISVVSTELAQNLKVFPNPASNYLYITLGGSVPTTSVRLIDLTGKVLQERRLDATNLNTTISMPVSNYAKGIYILQAIKADGTKWSTKVTIGITQ